MSVATVEASHTSAPTAPVKLRKARLADSRRIHELVNYYADREEMLHRTVPEICENIRDYVVAELDGVVVACCGLQVNLDTLAEIKSLAVEDGRQGNGIGSILVKECLREAEQLEVPSVFALTYRPSFFERLGFRQVNKSTLPRKVWGECIRCPKFPDCGEIAVLIDLAVNPLSENPLTLNVEGPEAPGMGRGIIRGSEPEQTRRASSDSLLQL
ncbi:MAG: N-acetyltransferase [Chloroflexi bacterium]|nr:N-acetyltransferase [Chloroflexota bacterium]